MRSAPFRMKRWAAHSIVAEITWTDEALRWLEESSSTSPRTPKRGRRNHSGDMRAWPSPRSISRNWPPVSTLIEKCPHHPVRAFSHGLPREGRWKCRHPRRLPGFARHREVSALNDIYHALERAVEHRGPRLAAARSSGPAAQLGRSAASLVRGRLLETPSPSENRGGYAVS